MTYINDRLLAALDLNAEARIRSETFGRARNFGDLLVIGRSDLGGVGGEPWYMSGC